MSDWECPCCKRGYDSGHYPDHWSDGTSPFEFECDCGAVLHVSVDWSPDFTVYEFDPPKYGSHSGA